MSNYLIKTSESSVKTDKNGRNYKTVVFTEVKTLKTPFGDVLKPINQSVSSSINCYEQSYLNDKMELGYADPIFDGKNPSKGGIFEGSIEKRMVEEYDITDSKGDIRSVNTYSTVVFGDTSSPAYETNVITAFKSRGREITTPVEITARVEEQAAF